jgi:hypothetical protein
MRGWLGGLVLAIGAAAGGSASADALLADTFVGYPDHGWGDVIGDAAEFGINSVTSHYDTHTGEITLTVSTNYVNPVLGTVFGDLFLAPTWTVGGRCTDASCSNPATLYHQGDWSYAVHLTNGSDPTQGASLYRLPSTGPDAAILAHVDLPGSWIYRDGQAVQIDPSKAQLIGGATSSVDALNHTVTFGFLPPAEFLTYIAGMSLSYNLALSWGATCGNDLIQGVLAESGLPVPEPTTLTLIASGLMILLLSRRRLV